jgi:hypothetical protein
LVLLRSDFDFMVITTVTKVVVSLLLAFFGAPLHF